MKPSSSKRDDGDRSSKRDRDKDREKDRSRPKDEERRRDRDGDRVKTQDNRDKPERRSTYSIADSDVGSFVTARDEQGDDRKDPRRQNTDDDYAPKKRGSLDDYGSSKNGVDDRASKPSRSSRQELPSSRPSDGRGEPRIRDRAPPEDFDQQVHNQSFSQFPGQHDSAYMPGSFEPSSSARPDERFSDHVPDQFPGQFPAESSAPSRSAHGLAAEYYNDAGQSVHAQPGVRPHTPDIIMNPDSHLMTASATDAPPPEPSTHGSVGAAASFYTAAGVPSASSNSSGPPNSTSQGPSRPSRISISSSAPIVATLGLGAAGLAARMMAHHQAQTQSSSAQGVSSAYHTASSGQSSTYVNPNTGPYEPNVNGATAGVGGAAAASASQYYLNQQSASKTSHQQSYPESRPNNPVYSTPQPSEQSLHFRRRNRSGLAKLVDWWKDYEDVAKMEEYTEYIGVCRDCFPPGTSARDAPRRHNHDHRVRKRRSTDRPGLAAGQYGSDKRYSESEKRRDARNGVLGTAAAGMAAYGLMKASGSGSDEGAKKLRRKRSQLERESSEKATKRSSARASTDSVRFSDPRRESQTELRSDEKLEKRSSLRQRSTSRERRSSKRQGEVAAAAAGVVLGSIAGSRRTGRRHSNSSSNASASQEIRRKKLQRKSNASFFGNFFSSSSSKSSRKSKSPERSDRDGKGRRKERDSARSSTTRLVSEKSDSKNKQRKERDPDLAIAGLAAGIGATAAALSMAKDRDTKASKSSRMTPTATMSADETSRMQGGRKTAQHGDWEDASNSDSAFSVDSALAFGSEMQPRRRRGGSQRSSSSETSNLDKWNWRWNKRRQSDSDRESVQSASEQRVQMFKYSSATGGPSSSSENRLQSSRQQSLPGYESYPGPSPSLSSQSLQTVYPVMSGDPTSYDTRRAQSITSQASSATIQGAPWTATGARPAPAPIQHPQPQAPLPADLYSTPSKFDSDARRRSVSKVHDQSPMNPFLYQVESFSPPPERREQMENQARSQAHPGTGMKDVAMMAVAGAAAAAVLPAVMRRSSSPVSMSRPSEKQLMRRATSPVGYDQVQTPSRTKDHSKKVSFEPTVARINGEPKSQSYGIPLPPSQNQGAALSDTENMVRQAEARILEKRRRKAEGREIAPSQYSEYDRPPPPSGGRESMPRSREDALDDLPPIPSAIPTRTQAEEVQPESKKPQITKSVRIDDRPVSRSKEAFPDLDDMKTSSRKEAVARKAAGKVIDNPESPEETVSMLDRWKQTDKPVSDYVIPDELRKRSNSQRQRDILKYNPPMAGFIDMPDDRHTKLYPGPDLDRVGWVVPPLHFIPCSPPGRRIGVGKSGSRTPSPLGSPAIRPKGTSNEPSTPVKPITALDRSEPVGDREIKPVERPEDVQDLPSKRDEKSKKNSRKSDPDDRMYDGPADKQVDIRKTEEIKTQDSSRSPSKRTKELPGKADLPTQQAIDDSRDIVVDPEQDFDSGRKTKKGRTDKQDNKDKKRTKDKDVTKELSEAMNPPKLPPVDDSRDDEVDPDQYFGTERETKKGKRDEQDSKNAKNSKELPEQADHFTQQNIGDSKDGDVDPEESFDTGRKSKKSKKDKEDQKDKKSNKNKRDSKEPPDKVDQPTRQVIDDSAVAAAEPDQSVEVGRKSKRESKVYSEPKEKSDSKSKKEKKKNRKSQSQDYDSDNDAPAPAELSRDTPAPVVEETVTKTDETRKKPSNGFYGKAAAGLAGIALAAQASAWSKAGKPDSKKDVSQDDTPERSKEAARERKSSLSSSPATEKVNGHQKAVLKDLSSSSNRRDSMPGSFGEDIDFTATVAAGLESQGMDPNLVLDDKTFRRRHSPPGSGDERGTSAPRRAPAADLSDPFETNAEHRTLTRNLSGSVAAKPAAILPLAIDAAARVTTPITSAREISTQKSELDIAPLVARGDKVASEVIKPREQASEPAPIRTSELEDAMNASLPPSPSEPKASLASALVANRSGPMHGPNESTIPTSTAPVAGILSQARPTSDDAAKETLLSEPFHRSAEPVPPEPLLPPTVDPLLHQVVEAPITPTAIQQSRPTIVTRDSAPSPRRIGTRPLARTMGSGPHPPSTTQAPLNFRFGIHSPSSPGSSPSLNRTISVPLAFPLSPLPALSPGSRKGRSRPNSTEFQPLYLLEKHRTLIQNEPDEPYPELPLSRESSVSGSPPPEAVSRFARPQSPDRQSVASSFDHEFVSAMGSQIDTPVFQSEASGERDYMSAVSSQMATPRARPVDVLVKLPKPNDFNVDEILARERAPSASTDPGYFLPSDLVQSVEPESVHHAPLPITDTVKSSHGASSAVEVAEDAKFKPTPSEPALAHEDLAHGAPIEDTRGVIDRPPLDEKAPQSSTTKRPHDQEPSHEPPTQSRGILGGASIIGLAGAAAGLVAGAVTAVLPLSARRLSRETQPEREVPVISADSPVDQVPLIIEKEAAPEPAELPPAKAVDEIVAEPTIEPIPDPVLKLKSEKELEKEDSKDRKKEKKNKKGSSDDKVILPEVSEVLLSKKVKVDEDSQATGKKSKKSKKSKNEDAAFVEPGPAREVEQPRIEDETIESWDTPSKKDQKGKKGKKQDEPEIETRDLAVESQTVVDDDVSNERAAPAEKGKKETKEKKEKGTKDKKDKDTKDTDKKEKKKGKDKDKEKKEKKDKKSNEPEIEAETLMIESHTPVDDDVDNERAVATEKDKKGKRDKKTKQSGDLETEVQDSVVNEPLQSQQQHVQIESAVPPGEDAEDEWATSKQKDGKSKQSKKQKDVSKQSKAAKAEDKPEKQSNKSKKSKRAGDGTLNDAEAVIPEDHTDVTSTDQSRVRDTKEDGLKDIRSFTKTDDAAPSITVNSTDIPQTTLSRHSEPPQEPRGQGLAIANASSLLIGSALKPSETSEQKEVRQLEPQLSGRKFNRDSAIELASATASPQLQQHFHPSIRDSGFHEQDQPFDSPIISTRAIQTPASRELGHSPPAEEPLQVDPATKERDSHLFRSPPRENDHQEPVVAPSQEPLPQIVVPLGVVKEAAKAHEGPRSVQQDTVASPKPNVDSGAAGFPSNPISQSVIKHDREVAPQIQKPPIAHTYAPSPAHEYIGDNSLGTPSERPLETVHEEATDKQRSPSNSREVDGTRVHLHSTSESAVPATQGHIAQQPTREREVNPVRHIEPQSGLKSSTVSTVTSSVIQGVKDRGIASAESRPTQQFGPSLPQLNLAGGAAPIQRDQASPRISSPRIGSTRVGSPRISGPPDFRSSSRNSNLSNLSGNRQSGTPPLRRINRSTSSDLRAAAKQSVQQEQTAAQENEPGSPIFGPIGAASSSSYDQVTDKGKGKIADMADLYEGYGDRMGNPMSPTRAPSIRRRQSMQIIDLETRLDQIASENRLLTQTRQNLERSLEETIMTHDKNSRTMGEVIQTREVHLKERDGEVMNLKQSLEWSQREVQRLSAVNAELTAASAGLISKEIYDSLETQHNDRNSRLEDTSRELAGLRDQHNRVSSDIPSLIDREVKAALQQKNRQLEEFQMELDDARAQINQLKQQILESKPRENFLTVRDEDYFERACQQVCTHMQQWVQRFSKFSDMRVSRMAYEMQDENMLERVENTILDNSDVNVYLQDRRMRRDVFMSLAMNIIYEFVFQRYLFGMDQEQRQKLKKLEKQLGEVGQQAAVHRWRATTLTLLSRRPAFATQRQNDTEAVVQEVFSVLSHLLPPPKNMELALLQSLRKVIKEAVELSVEMRTQTAEFMMMPPLRPEYDTNGDLVRSYPFNATLMNERSGDSLSNAQVEQQGSAVQVQLFPLVVKQGNDQGEGFEQIVVYQAQVIVAKQAKGKSKERVFSGDVDMDRSSEVGTPVDPRARSTMSLTSTMTGVTGWDGAPQ